jgi:hypothetical protein
MPMGHLRASDLEGASVRVRIKISKNSASETMLSDGGKTPCSSRRLLRMRRSCVMKQPLPV